MVSRFKCFVRIIDSVFLVLEICYINLFSLLLRQIFPPGSQLVACAFNFCHLLIDLAQL